MMVDELVRAAAGGDEDAFAQLVALHEKKVYNLALRMCGDPEDAWDAAQEAFLSAWRGLPSFRGEAGFSTWLYRIAYTTAISATRKKRNEFLYLEDLTINNVADEQVDEAFNKDDSAQLLTKLEKGIELLSPDERGLITLFYMENHPVEEIAAVTGLSESNVKVKLHRIRKKLYLIIKEMP